MVLRERTESGIIETALGRMVQVVKEDRVDNLLDGNLLNLVRIVERESDRGDLGSVWPCNIHVLIRGNVLIARRNWNE